MSKNKNQNTCPVCFTKMRTVDDVLVCPECGYKLCDHSYNYHDSYSTEHVHTPHYTTTSQTAQPGRTAAPVNPTQAPRPAQTAQTPPVLQKADANTKRVIKIVRTVFIVYFLAMLFSALGPVIASLFSDLFY